MNITMIKGRTSQCDIIKDVAPVVDVKRKIQPRFSVTRSKVKRIWSTLEMEMNILQADLVILME